MLYMGSGANDQEGGRRFQQEGGGVQTLFRLTRKLRPQDQRALFYWFFEAQEAPSLKPLVLWLNEGPSVSEHEKQG
jgi:carboxypeptidase C (cathepsin A)